MKRLISDAWYFLPPGPTHGMAVSDAWYFLPPGPTHGMAADDGDFLSCCHLSEHHMAADDRDFPQIHGMTQKRKVSTKIRPIPF